MIFFSETLRFGLRALTWLALAIACLNTQAAPLKQDSQDSMAKRMQACTTCHGAESSGGRTANEVYFPRIAGKPAGYLYSQLLNFKEGRRHYGLMVGMVEYLSDDYLLEMAQYFAKLEVPYPPPAPVKSGTSNAMLERGKTLVLLGDKVRGIPACVACHGSALMGVAPLETLSTAPAKHPSMPALLGLPRDYLVSQLGAWQTGLRRAHAPDCMGRIAKQLKPDDIDALASWLSMQPVPLGAKPAATLPAPMPESCGGVK